MCTKGACVYAGETRADDRSALHLVRHPAPPRPLDREDRHLAPSRPSLCNDRHCDGASSTVPPQGMPY
eukprot:8066667-Pyramimonas_sp.AAC.1